MKRDLQKEFDCQKSLEKSLVDQVVSSYVRKISYTKLMEIYNNPEWLSHERVSLLKFYSLEVDRAHRQFLSALETLQALKQPPLKINLRAHNAFLAQNQQLNNQQEQAGQKNKNNEPK
jgi:hypothetical protein